MLSHFVSVCHILLDSTEKYDSRDVERLQSEDALVEGYLTWRLYVVDDALKMIDESLQWRKEFGVNGMSPMVFIPLPHNALNSTIVPENHKLSLSVWNF